MPGSLLNTSLKSAPQYARFLPGAVPPSFAPQVYRSTPKPDRHGGSTDTQPVASASQNAGALIGMTPVARLEPEAARQAVLPGTIPARL